MNNFDLFNMDDLIKMVNDFGDFVKENKDTMGNNLTLSYPHWFSFKYNNHSVSYSFEYIPRFDKPFWVYIRVQSPFECKMISGAQIMATTIEDVKEKLLSEKYQTQDLIRLLDSYCERLWMQS